MVGGTKVGGSRRPAHSEWMRFSQDRPMMFPNGSRRRGWLLVTMHALPAILILIGCSTPRVETPEVLGAGSCSDLGGPGDPRFSFAERRAIAAARAYLEASGRKPLDARYRVDRTRDGYEVFVMFVGGYENGRPLYYPGGHGTVVLRTDRTFVRYMPGA